MQPQTFLVLGKSHRTLEKGYGRIDDVPEPLKARIQFVFCMPARAHHFLRPRAEHRQLVHGRVGDLERVFVGEPALDLDIAGSPPGPAAPGGRSGRGGERVFGSLAPGRWSSSCSSRRLPVRPSASGRWCCGGAPGARRLLALLNLAGTNQHQQVQTNAALAVSRSRWARSRSSSAPP